MQRETIPERKSEAPTSTEISPTTLGTTPFFYYASASASTETNGTASLMRQHSRGQDDNALHVVASAPWLPFLPSYVLPADLSAYPQPSQPQSLSQPQMQPHFYQTDPFSLPHNPFAQPQPQLQSQSQSQPQPHSYVSYPMPMPMPMSMSMSLPLPLLPSLLHYDHPFPSPQPQPQPQPQQQMHMPPQIHYLPIPPQQSQSLPQSQPQPQDGVHAYFDPAMNQLPRHQQQQHQQQPDKPQMLQLPPLQTATTTPSPVRSARPLQPQPQSQPQRQSSSASQPHQRPRQSQSQTPQPQPPRRKKPINAFFIYSKIRRTEIRRMDPFADNYDILRRIAADWRLLSPSEKTTYEQIAHDTNRARDSAITP